MVRNDCLRFIQCFQRSGNERQRQNLRTWKEVRDTSVHNRRFSTVCFRFRSTILARGGTVSMRELFREFRSREPNYEHYIQRLTTQV